MWSPIPENFIDLCSSMGQRRSVPPSCSTKSCMTMWCWVMEADLKHHLNLDTFGLKIQTGTFTSTLLPSFLVDRRNELPTTRSSIRWFIRTISMMILWKVLAQTPSPPSLVLSHLPRGELWHTHPKSLRITSHAREEPCCTGTRTTDMVERQQGERTAGGLLLHMNTMIPQKGTGTRTIWRQQPPYMFLRFPKLLI